MSEYAEPPEDPYDVPEHLVTAWAKAWAHIGRIDALMWGEWQIPQLTTGDDVYDVTTHDAAHCSICAPAVLHNCNVRFLGRSWRSEGCGWRCPTCTTEWTLTIVHKLYEEHATQYGTHPRSQCGPALCDLLPPRPVMQWTRDEVTD